MLQIENLSKAYDELEVLKGVSLSVERGEIVCLLGPSGCGKTTLLRSIAGLEQPDGGRILLESSDISRVPVHQRGFGLMFQDFALFPHLSVTQNVAFGLQMLGESRAAQRERVAKVLALVGLSAFAERSVTELSGGEQQRVALARSLAPRPRLLMLDEPLGSLDASLRERLVADLREIIKAAGVTALYVTHDQSEAFTISDRIAVMNAGLFEQVSAPQELYLRPKTVFVAEFIGLRNIVPIEKLHNEKAENGVGLQAETALGQFPLSLNGTPDEQNIKHLLLHPSYLELSPADTPDTIKMQVVSSIFRGDQYHLTLRHTSGQILWLQIPTTAPQIPALGDTASLRVSEAGVLALR